MNYKITQIVAEREVNFIHSGSGTGQDYTLCGLAMEGMGRKVDFGNDWHSVSVDTESKINCPMCIRIIKHCKSIKL